MWCGEDGGVQPMCGSKRVSLAVALQSFPEPGYDSNVRNTNWVFMPTCRHLLITTLDDLRRQCRGRVAETRLFVVDKQL